MSDFSHILRALCEHPDYAGNWAWSQLAYLVYKDGSRTSEIGRLLNDNPLYWSKAAGPYMVRFHWDRIVAHGLLPKPRCSRFIELCNAVREVGLEDEALPYGKLAKLKYGLNNDINRLQIANLVKRHRLYIDMQVAAIVSFRWDLIQLDPPPQRDIVEELLEALEHETEEGWRAARKSPQKIHDVKRLVGNALLGDCYRGKLEDREDEDPVPFLEGMPVLVEWTKGQPVSATLLVYNVKTLDVVLEFSKPQIEQETCRIYPDRLRLLKGYRPFIERFHQNALAKEVFGGSGPLDPPFDGLLRLHAGDGKEGAKGLRPEQEEVVRTGLANKVLFLWGPPGTGKTFTLAAMIVELVLRGERVLAVSISNRAVDELTQAVYSRLQESEEGRALLHSRQVLRLGFPSQEILEHEELFPHHDESRQVREEIVRLRNELKETEDAGEQARLRQKLKGLDDRHRTIVKGSLGRASIVFTTVAQVALIKEFRACEPLSREAESNTRLFSSVVCDEASMMNVSHLIPLCWWGTKRVIIAGDPKQLGPVVVSRSRVSRLHLQRDLFSYEMEHPEAHQRVMQLTSQSRMHESICRLVNEAFYRGTLSTISTSERVTLPPMMKKGRLRAGIVRVNGGEARMTRSGSHFNEEEAKVVMDLLSLLRKEGEESIGIVTAYRAQAGKIRRLLKEAGWDKDNRIQLGTVHAFQGGERSVIIWNLVDTRMMRKPNGNLVEAKPGRLFNDNQGRRLTNVAISRAKAGIYIVGDTRFFCRYPPNPQLPFIIRQIEGEGHIWRSNQLERDWENVNERNDEVEYSMD